MVGPRAGERVLRIGARVGGVEEGENEESSAARRVSAEDKKGLERLARYALRPALAQNRLRVSAEGKVVWELKRMWSDGTSHFAFEPVDFLSKLAALVFPPRTHRIRYHGVWARRSKLRDRVRPKALESAVSETEGCAHGEADAHPRHRRRRYSWSKLLARVFAADVLECPRCHSKEMQQIAVITQADAIRRILTSVGMAADSPKLSPARSWGQGELFDAA